MNTDVENSPGLYTVDSRFIDPARLSAWLEWYASHIKGLLTKVPGFLHAQRFRRHDRKDDSYLGIYALRSLSVLSGPEYLEVMKGGRFPDEWAASIVDWNRGFYQGIDVFPAVADSELLLVMDSGHEKLGELPGLDFRWVRATGLNPRAERRGFAIVDRQHRVEHNLILSGMVRLFEPIAPRLSQGALG